MSTVRRGSKKTAGFYQGLISRAKNTNEVSDIIEDMRIDKNEFRVNDFRRVMANAKRKLNMPWHVAAA